jgi:hypothetical protein
MVAQTMQAPDLLLGQSHGWTDRYGEETIRLRLRAVYSLHVDTHTSFPGLLAQIPYTALAS